MDPIHGSLQGPVDRARSQEAFARAQAVLGLPELRRILEHPGASEVPVSRQIFVNRNLALPSVELIGFDMDYTLAIYHLRRVEHLAYELTLKRLVAQHGYPASLTSLSYDHGSVIRGLFVDKRHGNLVKMDRFGHVGRAVHGHVPLEEEALDRLYRNERIRLKNPDYAWIDTLFALPEAALYHDIVQRLEVEAGQHVEHRRLYDDIRLAIDTVHRDNSLKALIRQDLPTYVYKDPELGSALHRLRSGGKRLFLLTNSLWDYTQAIMSYLLDGVLAEYPSWRNYFDVVITGAGKPGFFSQAQPFLELDVSKADFPPLGPASTLERGRVYQGGNLLAFEKLTGHAGNQVLYVGDHIYGDILKTRKTSMWRTCMVVQEIEDEISYLESRRSEIDRLAELELLQARLEDEINRRKSRLNQVERRLDRLPEADAARPALEAEFKVVKAELDSLRKANREARDVITTLAADVEEGFNPRWGLVFKEGSENSRFGEQVEQYACLYTSRVSNFGFYSPASVFRSPREVMPHEQAGAASSRLSMLGGEGLPKAANRAPTEIP